MYSAQGLGRRAPPAWNSKLPPPAVKIKGIAYGGEDASFAEARAGRREVVVTELQTLARADT